MLLKRLSIFISFKRKKQLVLLLVLMLLASVAEVMSIGAVLPFLGVLANPEAIYEYEFVQPLIAWLGVEEPKELLLPFTAIFALAAVVAGSMRILLLWGQTRLAHAIGSDLSYEIYRRTLYQPFSVHVSRNSSEVIAGISIKAKQIVSAMILPTLMIISSLMMLTMIIATLVAIDPLVASGTMVGFSLIYGLFVWFTRSHLISNSKQISEKTNLVIKALQEGLGGIRDVLVDGTQYTYCKSFQSADVSLRRAVANNQIMGQSPRYGVESLGMVLIAFLAYAIGRGEGGIVEALPVLGALAIGAQKMLPLLQQMYRAWSSMRGSHVVLYDALDLLEQSLPQYIEKVVTETVPFRQSIKLDNLGFRYDEQGPFILEDLNLEIQKGARIGIVGTTGSGKSTLLDIVMGLLHPSKGRIAVDGVEVSDRNHRGWQLHIAHIPQTIFLADTTIAENIAFGVPQEKIDQNRVCNAAQQAQIADAIESWNMRYQTVVGERGMRLSGGQRQRIGIARALYKKADVIIFDEATSSLDNNTERAVLDAVDGIGGDITIIIVAHRVSTLKNCDRIIELENGKVARSGAYEEIIGV